MFRILDRYLLTNFLFSFVLLLAIILALLTAVQVATDLDEFVGLSEQGYSWLEITITIGKFSLYNLPRIFYHFSPYITLMAAMFSVTRLHKNNELAPMKAVGISTYRIFLPFLVWSVLVAGLAAVDQEKLIPRLGLDLQRLHSLSKGDVTTRRPYPRTEDGFGNQWWARWHDTRKEQLEIVIFETPEGPLGNKKLIARTAKWIGSDRPEGPGWMLHDVEIVRFNPNDDPARRTLRRQEVEHREQVFIPSFGVSTFEQPVTDMRPQDLISFSRDSLEADLLSMGELRERIRQQRSNIKGLTMALHRRFSHPLANVVLLMLGLPLVAGCHKRRLTAGILMAIVACILFEVLSLLCQSVVYEDFMTPELCAWLPLVIFSAVAVYLFDSMETF